MMWNFHKHPPQPMTLKDESFANGYCMLILVFQMIQAFFLLNPSEKVTSLAEQQWEGGTAESLGVLRDTCAVKTLTILTKSGS